MRSKFLYLSIRRSFVVGRAWKRDQKGADLMSVDGRPPIVADSVLKSVLAVIHSDDMAKNSHDSSGIRALIQDQQIKENLAHGGNSLVQLPKLTHSTYARVRDRMHLEREPSGRTQTSTRRRAGLEIANALSLAAVMANLASCPLETFLNTDELGVFLGVRMGEKAGNSFMICLYDYLRYKVLFFCLFVCFFI